MSDEEKLVSHYRLKTLLRKDGFGAVYFAEDTRDQKACVLRVIELDHPTLTRITGHVRARSQRDHPLIEQIRQRMKRISELKNSHILQVIEFGEEHIQGNNDIIFYMVSPYEKESLLSYWSEHTSSAELISLEIVSELIFQAAEGLFYVHRHGLVHQYVRLSSFMLHETVRSHKLHLYLTDFWFADISAALLEDGQISQDLSVYLASEQLAGHAVAASDQYALAILAYELLLGYRLSQVDLSIGLYERFIRQRGAEASEVELQLAHRIDMVLARALAENAAARYANIEEFASMFRAVASGEVIELEEDTAKLPVIARFAQSSSQSGVEIAAGALVAGELAEAITEERIEGDEATHTRHTSLHKTVLTAEGMEVVDSGEAVEVIEETTVNGMAQSGAIVGEEETLTVSEEERTRSSAGAVGAAGLAVGLAAGEILQHETDISEEQTQSIESNAATFAAGEARQREIESAEETRESSGTAFVAGATGFAAGLAAGEILQSETEASAERTETRESSAAAFAGGLAAGEALSAEQTQIIATRGASAGGAEIYEQETNIFEDQTQNISAKSGALLAGAAILEVGDLLASGLVGTEIAGAAGLADSDLLAGDFEETQAADTDGAASASGMSVLDEAELVGSAAAAGLAAESAGAGGFAASGEAGTTETGSAAGGAAGDTTQATKNAAGAGLIAGGAAGLAGAGLAGEGARSGYAGGAEQSSGATGAGLAAGGATGAAGLAAGGTAQSAGAGLTGAGSAAAGAAGAGLTGAGLAAGGATEAGLAAGGTAQSAGATGAAGAGLAAGGTAQSAGATGAAGTGLTGVGGTAQSAGAGLTGAGLAAGGAAGLAGAGLAAGGTAQSAGATGAAGAGLTGVGGTAQSAGATGAAGAGLTGAGLAAGGATEAGLAAGGTAQSAEAASAGFAETVLAAAGAGLAAGEAGAVGGLVAGGTTQSMGGGAVGGTVLSASDNKRRGRTLLVAIIIALLLLLVFGSISAYALGQSSSATVTLTLASHTIQSTYLVTATTSASTTTTSTTSGQVQANFLQQTASLSQSGQASGYYPGVEASGFIKLSNRSTGCGCPTFIPAGTSFVSGSGVTVVIDYGVSVASLCSVTVPAHAMVYGPGGDISAGNVQSAYSPHIQATNPYAFTGGQGGQNNALVQQSDIDHLASSLRTQVVQSAETNLQAQVKSNQRLFAQPDCKTEVKSDHAAGDNASSVNVTVTTICAAEAYDYNSAMQIVQQQVQTEANSYSSDHYSLANGLQTTVTSATVTDAKAGTVLLAIKVFGKWIYKLSNGLENYISGKSVSDARAILLQFGAARVAINITGFNANTLPSDSSKIKIIVKS